MKVNKKQSKTGVEQNPQQEQSSSKLVGNEENGFKLFTGDGFQLKIPKTHSTNILTGDGNQWGYGEFFSPVIQSEEEKAEVDGVFYYWTKDKLTSFKRQTIGKLCREVIAKHLFETGLRLHIIDSFKTNFGNFPAMVLRYRYEFEAYQASGPLHLFVVGNLDQKRLFILGILAERSGDSWRETQTIQSLEDSVVMSFEFIDGRSKG